MPRRALILSGSLGLGHDVVSEILASSLEELGWQCRTLDCMKLLGSVGARAGDKVFRRLTATPSLYDSLHFAHLRPGSKVAAALDRSATKRLVPAVRREIESDPADLVVSTFATGASTASKLARKGVVGRNVVICTDACLYRFWVWEEVDLFVVTSEAAAASVRRYVPRARTWVGPPPVRRAFYRVASQPEARERLGIPVDVPCVLVMGGGWGLGPISSTARALADEGVHVLAVAGRNKALARRLRAQARRGDRIHAFGFTNEVPELMSACDLVLTTSGATTCGEARVVGRKLMLVDVVPGHGRENLQHELERGNAEACDSSPNSVTASVLAALDDIRRPLPLGRRDAGEWDTVLAGALGSLGLGATADPATTRPVAV